MKDQAQITVQETLQESHGRAYLAESPRIYEPNQFLIEAANRGELVTEAQAFEAYFSRLEEGDAEYMVDLRQIVQERATLDPDILRHNSAQRLKFVVPAYREGENMPAFLEQIRAQFDQSPTDDWGITFVMDYAIPNRNPNEEEEMQRMEEILRAFLKENPHFANNIDYVAYTRNRNPQEPVLPLGLARKLGNDVLMYERLQAIQTLGDDPTRKPLSLGLMDMDTGDLTPGILATMAHSTAETESDTPRCIKARGSFDLADKKENLHLYPLQLMWEGPLSAVALNTKYNPFTIGRLSAVPARELAMTGGGFPRKRPFPDEDIRNGIQIAAQLHNVEHVEVNGQYSTSARREIGTMNGVLELMEKNGGQFTREMMEVAALIKMYGDWANHSFRRDLGNVTLGQNGENVNPLTNPEVFNQVVQPKLIELMTNAGYRFTAFAMFAVDELWQSKEAHEVHTLMAQMLAGEKAHFEVELETMDVIAQIAKTDPTRFNALKPALARADAHARAAVIRELDRWGVNFDIDETGTQIYGILEEAEDGQKTDQVVLQSPFIIHEDQSVFMDNIRRDLGIEE